jgi:RHS repeat-associated protein
MTAEGNGAPDAGILDVPTIEPFQFDTPGLGSLQKTVNLFRGDVNFKVPLVSLAGRNGLDVEVAALYRSDVDRSASHWNRDEPTSILGLGWDMPVDRIAARGDGSATREGNTYYFVRDNGWNRLYRTARTWIRGELDPALAGSLDAGKLDPPLQQALLGQGLEVDGSSKVETVEPGSGWRIADPVHERILAVDRGESSLLVSDGGLAYEAQSFDFSRIRYYPAFERWEITYANGITFAFGGTAGESVEWAVRWGSWAGASSLTHKPGNPSERAQQRYATGWNLSAAYTAWGDTVEFEYEQVQQAVGGDGLPYTKACYLSRIADVFGRTVSFEYDEKEFVPEGDEKPREYFDPNKPVPSDAPDAYQSRYETRFLSGVAVASEEGEPLSRLDIEYELASYATLGPDDPPSLPGDSVKRTLVRIVKTMPNGTSLPPVEFTYYSAADTHPGALRSMTYPEGGTATYVYAKTDLSACERSMRIDSPFAGATPRVWFGSDYAVVAWYDDQGKLELSVYTWIGRWRKWQPPEPTIEQSVEMSDISVELEDEFFVLHYGTANGQSAAIWAFHKDERTLGSWVPAAFNPLVLESVDRELASGSGFFAVCDRYRQAVTTYVWEPLSTTWTEAQVPSVCDLGAAETRLYVTGAGQAMGVLCYDLLSAPGSKLSMLLLQTLDDLGQWRRGDPVRAPEIEIAEPHADDFTWSAAPWMFAAGFVTEELDSALRHRVALYTWDTEGGPPYRLLPPAVFDYELKKTESGQVTQPIQPAIASPGMVSSGPHLLRYNGAEWLRNDNLETIEPVSDDTVFWFSLGPDYALKTESSPDRVIGAAQVYDPNTQATAWDEEAIPLFDNPPEDPRLQRYFPTAAPSLLSWDCNLYARGTSTDWRAPLSSLPLRQLPAGVDTTTIVNEGPDFLVYLVTEPGEGEEEKVVGTQVLALRNGQVDAVEEIPERMFQLVRSDGSLEGEVSGKLPGAPSAFLSYLPLDAEFDHAETIFLHRFLDESALAPVVDRPAVAVEFADGFQTVVHGFGFDAETAACDASGGIAKYYSSKAWVGGPDRPSGWTEYSFVNGLGQAGPEGPESPSLLDGLPAAKRVYDASGDEVASTQTSWQVETEIVDLASGETVPIRGAYIQATATTRVEDGLSLTASYTYDPASGQRLSEESTGYDARAEEVTKCASTRYGFQVYPALARANDLTSVVQQKATVKVGAADPVVTSSSAIAWRPFERPTACGPASVWAESARWDWLGGEGSADFPFAAEGAWGAPSGWFEVSRSISRSPHGLELEREAPIGKTISKIYDRLEGIAVASFSLSGAGAGEAYYYGFERYEQPGPWTLDPASTPIVSDTSNCGARALEVPPGATAATLRLTPPGGARHLFSFWARTDTGLGSDDSAGWRLSVDGQPQIAVPVAEGGEWRYYAKLLDLSEKTGAVAVELTAFNSGKAPIYIDDVAFASYEAQFAAGVYEEPFLRRTAEVGPYDNLVRTAYDPLGRPIARTDRSQSVVETTVPYLATQDGVAPSPQLPNMSAKLQPRGETLYERFADGDGWKDRWQTGTPGQWSVANGRLLHAAGATGSLEGAEPLDGPFYLSVCLEASDPVGAELGIGIDSTTIAWDPAAKRWKLGGPEGSSEAPFASEGPGNRWVLAITDAALVFLVDGRPAFASPQKSLPHGKPRLFAGSEVAFGELIVAASPLLAATFFDGAAKPRQGHSVESAATTITASLYDSVGRAAVITKPALLAPSAGQPLLSYREDFVTELDWDSGVMKGALADALPEDEGFPYSRTRFEPSPLSRAVEAGAPGKEFAITAAPPQERKTAKTVFGSNAEGGFPADLKLPPGQYRLTTKIDPDGIEMPTVTDKWGQTIAGGLLLDPTQGKYLTTSYAYDYEAASQTSTVRLPNYHDPPDPAHREAWQRRTVYDLRGRTIRTESPGAGAAECIYDLRGNLRFFQDAAGAAAGTVAYRRYDLVDRPLETGTIAMAWAPALLQQKAEDPRWPTAADGAVAAQTYRYDGDGEDVRQMGVLSGAVNGPEGDPDVGSVSLRHDERIRVAAVIERAPGLGAKPRETTYTYDNLGHPVTTTYPTGTVLAAERDSAGRVSTVREGEAVLASYAYDPGDRVVAETVHPGTAAELTTAYSYSSPGWLESIESPLMKQRLQYTGGGYEGAGYHNGKIARQDVELTVSDPGEFPASLSYEYAYDRSGRLLTANALVAGKPAPDFSLGLASPISYDANGNFLSVPVAGGEEVYSYEPGSDFANGKSGGGTPEYAAGPGGAAVRALPHGVTDITYDPVTHLPLTLATQGNGLIAFEYDPRGQRAAKRTAQGTRIYTRGLSGGSLVEELTATSGAATTTEYLYGPTGLLAIREQGRTLTVLHDHLRSPRALTDEGGAVLAAYQYLPFGSFAGRAYGEADALRYGFTGYELDGETGLYNAIARLYDPELRRFLQTDPRLQFASPYVYAANDPLSLVDPDGRAAWWAILLGAVAGAVVTLLTGVAGAFVASAYLGVGMGFASAADIAGSMAVGGIAGTTGSIAGDAVTAAASDERFTGKRALTDALSGLAGGAVGAGAGGLAGAAAVSAVEAEGVAAARLAGTAASLLAGGSSGALASVGVASAMTGQSPFSGGSAVGMVVGTIAGFGAALLASGTFLTYMNTMPRPLTADDYWLISGKMTYGEEGLDRRMLTFVDQDAYDRTEAGVIARYQSKNAIFEVQDVNGFIRHADVIALHGAGRYVLPETVLGFRRPMPASLFGDYLADYAGWDDAARQHIPVKLSICYASQPFGMRSSVGFQIAAALNRTVFAGRGLVDPVTSADPQDWVRFR